MVPHRNEVMKSLSLYYNTFVDLLDYKDKVSELLTTMDACQVSLDIVSTVLLTDTYSTQNILKFTS